MSNSIGQRTRAAAVNTAAAFAVAIACPVWAFAQSQLDIVATNLHSFTDAIVFLAFSPDGTQLASAKNCFPGVRLWTVPDLVSLIPDTGVIGGCGNDPTSVALSADNALVAIGAQSGRAIAASAKPLRYIGELSQI